MSLGRISTSEVLDLNRFYSSLAPLLILGVSVVILRRLVIHIEP